MVVLQLSSCDGNESCHTCDMYVYNIAKSHGMYEYTISRWMHRVTHVALHTYIWNMTWYVCIHHCYDIWYVCIHHYKVSASYHTHSNVYIHLTYDIWYVLHTIARWVRRVTNIAMAYTLMQDMLILQLPSDAKSKRASLSAYVMRHVPQLYESRHTYE